MPKRGENIYRRKDNRWEGRYLAYLPDGTRRRVSVYAKSYGEIKNKLLACREQARQNAAPLPLCKMTVENLFQKWLCAKAGGIKPSSWQRYAKIVANHLLPELGRANINGLTVQNLSAFLARKRKALAAKTVADILAVIKAAVKMAAAEYYLPQAAAILALKAPACRQKKIEPFGEREARLITARALAEAGPQGVAIVLALNSGLRLGEVCALQWSDIDFEAQTLSVERSVQRLTLEGRSRLLVQTPKSEASRRTVPLTAEILSLLRGLRKTSGGAYVFGGERPLEPRTLQYRFAALLKSCGVRRRSFHTLRHTFAGRYIEAGADVKSLSEIMGHARVSITMQLYVHPSMAQKRSHMENISTLKGLGQGCA